MSSLVEMDIELLEQYLDDELSEVERQALRQRLESEPLLAAELEQLESQRSQRQLWLSSLESDDGNAVRRVMAQVRGRYHMQRVVRALKLVTAAAACMVLGAVLSQVLGGDGESTQQPAVYQVALTDGSGQVVAVQRFDSLEQAQEFSEEVRRYQERRQRVLGGEVMLVAEQF